MPKPLNWNFVVKLFFIFFCVKDCGGGYYTCPALVEWLWICIGAAFNFFCKGPNGGGGGYRIQHAHAYYGVIGKYGFSVYMFFAS